MQPVEVEWSRDACVYNTTSLMGHGTFFKAYPMAIQIQQISGIYLNGHPRHVSALRRGHSVTSMEATLSPSMGIFSLDKISIG